jgi:hypothetical protein
LIAARAFARLRSPIGAAAAEAKKRKAEPPAKLYRKGVAFYALRHTFETIGYVHAWLYPRPTVG